MRAIIAIAALAACGDDAPSTRPPPDLPFVTRTIQLQPDDTGPRWTMRVPKAWTQDRHLVANVGGQDRLVNGANEPIETEEAATFWEDPDMNDGQFDLEISCMGDCAQREEARILDGLRQGNTVVEEHETPTEHTLVVKEQEGGLWVIRLWYVPGDTRFHSCGARVAKKFARYWRAYLKSCADVIEEPTTSR